MEDYKSLKLMPQDELIERIKVITKEFWRLQNKSLQIGDIVYKCNVHFELKKCKNELLARVIEDAKIAKILVDVDDALMSLTLK